MTKVDLGNIRLFALAASDWVPGQGVFPPVATKSKYFTKEEANLTMIRLYASPLRAAWASVCWKHSSMQPWIVKVDVTSELAIYKRSASSEVYWTSAISEKFILAAAQWFHWATAWPDDLARHMTSIDDWVDGGAQGPGSL